MANEHLFEVGQRLRPCRGQVVCGDAVVLASDGPALLVVLADGLGHGPEAARAAAAFCDSISADPTLPVHELMMRAHRQISGTRGVAGAVLRLDPVARQLSFSGVGNIECMACTRAAVRPVSYAGVVGHNVRKVQPYDYPLSPGDLVALISDGVSSRFGLEEYARLSASDMADAIVRDRGKAHDDASCVVVRFRDPATTG